MSTVGDDFKRACFGAKILHEKKKSRITLTFNIKRVFDSRQALGGHMRFCMKRNSEAEDPAKSKSILSKGKAS